MISNKFLGIIPDEFDVNHSLGYFFGKNFKSVKKVSEHFLSSSIYSYAKSHGYFIRGFLEGIKVGSVVPSRELQLALLQIGSNDRYSDDIHSNLADFLGEDFASIDGDIQEKILDLAEKKIYYGNRFFSSAIHGLTGLGTHLGRYFTSFNDVTVQKKILGVVKKNGKFAHGVSIGVGERLELQDSSFGSYSPSIYEPRWLSFNGMVQEKIWNLAATNDGFANGFGYQVASNLTYFESDNHILTKIFDLAIINDEFANGMGEGIVYNNEFSDLWAKKEIQLQMLNLAVKNKEFAMGLGYKVDRHLDVTSKDIQEKVWNLATSNDEFAKGWYRSINEWYLIHTIYRKIIFRVKLSIRKLFAVRFKK